MNLLAGAWGLTVAIGLASGPVLWPSADPIPHVFDVAGPRSDGRLVVAAGGKLFLLNQVTGAQERFAGGPDGYPGAGGEEPYIAVVPAAVASHSTFRLDDEVEIARSHRRDDFPDSLCELLDHPLDVVALNDTHATTVLRRAATASAIVSTTMSPAATRPMKSAAGIGGAEARTAAGAGRNAVLAVPIATTI